MGAVLHHLMTILVLLAAAQYAHSECECKKYTEDCKAFVSCVNADKSCSDLFVLLKSLGEKTNCDEQKILDEICPLYIRSFFEHLDSDEDAKKELKSKHPCARDIPEDGDCHDAKKHMPCVKEIITDVFEGKCDGYYPALDNIDCSSSKHALKFGKSN